MKGVIEAITEAVRLADRVESLSKKVSEMARAHREDARDLRHELHALDKRLVRIEALVEYTQKSIENKKQ